MSQAMETLKDSREPLWLEGCPVLLLSHTLLRQPDTGAVFARCLFQNVSGQTVSEASVSLSCTGGNWFPLRPVEDFLFSGLSAAPRETFGETILIPLPDPATRDFTVSVRRVVLEGGALWKRNSAQLQLLQAGAPLSSLGDYREQYLRDVGTFTSAPQRNLPCERPGWWQCGCGAVVPGAPGVCPQCGTVYQKLLEAANPRSLQEHLEETLRRQRAEEEGAKLQALQKAKKHKRIIIASILSSLVIAACAAALLHYMLVVRPETQYNEAASLLQQADYDGAHEAYLHLGNYRDAPQKAEEALLEKDYQSALEQAANGEYEAALDQFTRLGGYRDASAQVKEILVMQKTEEMEQYISQEDWEGAYRYYLDLSIEFQTATPILQLKEQCFEANPWKLCTILSTSNFNDENENYHGWDFTEEQQSTFSKRDGISATDPLYLHYYVSSGMPLISEYYTMDISWPNGSMTTNTFETVRKNEDDIASCLLLKSFSSMEPGRVTILIKRINTSEVVQVYQFMIESSY